MRHLVAHLDFQLAHGAGGGRGNVDGGLVGFQRDQVVFGGQHITDLDQDVNDGHILKIANIGNLDFNQLAHSSTLRMSFNN